MDPATLIDPASTPLPAPLWFIEFFKVLGFTLHASLMNLWYAGIVLAMALYAAGGENGRRVAGRLMRQMPLIVAYGINFGIVPLLFVQVAYFKVFYSATILMAWFWLGVIAMLIPAYYGVYLYSFGLRKDGPGLTPLRQAAGWCAALLFLTIGFIFANAMSLMTNVQGWPELWQATSKAGAALGTGLNLMDPTLAPRWLMMFGLALTTTAAWVVFDAAWLAGGETEEYKTRARKFALLLYGFGAIWFAAAGSWYVFGTWRGEVRDAMWQWPTVVLTLLTGAAPALPLALIFRLNKIGGEPSRRGAAAAIAAAQFGVIGINAVSRQIVQNIELSSYYQVLSQKTAVQWSPLIAFLLIFVAGVSVVVWMVRQVVKASAAGTGDRG
jgi:hypothetical protein